MADSTPTERRNAIEDAAFLLCDLNVKFDAPGLVSVVRYIESGD